MELPKDIGIRDFASTVLTNGKRIVPKEFRGRRYRVRTKRLGSWGLKVFLQMVPQVEIIAESSEVAAAEKVA